jgi:hypothetical protein
MRPPISELTLAIGPLGTWEMVIIAVLLLILGVIAGSVIFLVIYLNKKK